MHFQRRHIATRRDLERAMARALLLPPGPEIPLLEIVPSLLPDASLREPVVRR